MPVDTTCTTASAIFDPDRVYRYALTRTWEGGHGMVHICMLNPSTADEQVLDPTLRRCMGFAQRAGYAGMHITNLFAYRGTDPRELLTVADPIGPETDGWIRLYALLYPTWVGWGAVNKRLLPRVRAVTKLLNRTGRSVGCLGVTRSGQPRHPLYLHRATIARTWEEP